jgi:hypothetical protein
VVQFKQTSQALTGADFARRLTDPIRWRWKQNHIGLPLMVSFVVKMVSVIGKHVAEGSREARKPSGVDLTLLSGLVVTILRDDGADAGKHGISGMPH